MIEIKGTYTLAKVFTDTIEEAAIEQIKQLCDMAYTEGAKIRIMPDTHAGAGCTIGTTMTISDKLVPNLVGVDIGLEWKPYELKISISNLKNWIN